MRVLQRLTIFLIVHTVADVTAQEPIFRSEVNGFRLGNVTTIGNLRIQTLTGNSPHQLSDDWWRPGNFLYIHSRAILSFDPRTGEKHLIAGTNAFSTPPYQEGFGSAARFIGLTGFAQLSRDKVLTVSGGGGCCIRQVNRRTNGTSLVAGTCRTCGYVDGPLHSSLFNTPQSIVTDRGNFGIIYVSDAGNKVIREINLNTRIVSTFFDLGTGAFNDTPFSLALDPQGNHLYVASTTKLGKINLQTKKLTLLIDNPINTEFEDGPLASAKIRAIDDLAFLNEDTLLVADPGNWRLRIIDLKTNTVSSVCSGRQDIRGEVEGPIDQCALGGPDAIAVRPDKSGVLLTGFHPIRELTLTKIKVPPKTGRCPRLNPYSYIYDRELDCHGDADCGSGNKCCLVSHIWPKQCLPAILSG